MAETAGPIAALLRGINVGGRSKLAMADLRSALADAGLGGARTHLQSGNLILTPTSDHPDQVGAAVERAIEDRTGLSIRVMVRTREELAVIVDANPWRELGANPTSLHTVFLESAPDESRVAELDPDRSPPDRFSVSGREIYVLYPHGSGRSKLNLDYFERTLGVAGTARNWNTVTRLLDLLEG